MKWKYALILGDKTDECPDGHKPSCFLAEVYDLDNDGHYETFCEAKIESIEELQKAYADAMKDGINRWFYKNGKFTNRGNGLEWIPTHQSS